MPPAARSLAENPLTTGTPSRRAKIAGEPSVNSPPSGLLAPGGSFAIVCPDQPTAGPGTGAKRVNHLHLCAALGAGPGD